MKDRSNIRPVWLLAMITVPVLAAGFLCSAIYESKSMLYVSLALAALMVVAFPLAVLLGTLVNGTPGAGLRFIDFLRRLFTIRR